MKQQITVMATFANGSKSGTSPARHLSRVATSKLLKLTPAAYSPRSAGAKSPVLVRYEGAYAATTIIVHG